MQVCDSEKAAHKMFVPVWILMTVCGTFYKSNITIQHNAAMVFPFLMGPNEIHPPNAGLGHKRITLSCFKHNRHQYICLKYVRCHNCFGKIVTWMVPTIYIDGIECKSSEECKQVNKPSSWVFSCQHGSHASIGSHSSSQDHTESVMWAVCSLLSLDQWISTGTNRSHEDPSQPKVWGKMIYSKEQSGFHYTMRPVMQWSVLGPNDHQCNIEPFHPWCVLQTMNIANDLETGYFSWLMACSPLSFATYYAVAFEHAFNLGLLEMVNSGPPVV